MAVAVHAQPQRAFALATYMSIVTGLAHKVKGQAWACYVQFFRQAAASNLTLEWQCREPDIWLMALAEATSGAPLTPQLLASGMRDTPTLLYQPPPKSAGTGTRGRAIPHHADITTSAWSARRGMSYGNAQRWSLESDPYPSLKGHHCGSGTLPPVVHNYLVSPNLPAHAPDNFQQT